MAVPNSGGICQWRIPWEGGMAHLSVSQVPGERMAVLKVNGSVVASFAQPTLKAPWAECQLSSRPPVVKVAQIAYPRRRYRVVAFVDGISLDDQRTEAEWRADAPAPMSDLEAGRAAAGWVGRSGIVVAGAFAALYVLEWVRYRHLLSLLTAATAFILVSAWMIGNSLFLRWYVRRRQWSANVRQAVAALALGANIAAVILILLALGAIRSAY